MTPPPPKTGNCHCGAVSYEIDGPVTGIIACHCSQCRRQHGMFGPYVHLRTKDLRVTGEEAVRWYQSSETSRRGFCGTCGSSLFFEDIGGPNISISAGTLDQPTGLPLIGHIYTDDKADFTRLDEGLPAYGGSDKRELWKDQIPQD